MRAGCGDRADLSIQCTGDERRFVVDDDASHFRSAEVALGQDRMPVLIWRLECCAVYSHAKAETEEAAKVR